MQKTILKSLRMFAATYMLVAALISCGDDSGLGGQVDVSAPTIDILYPPASAIVRDSFVFAGICDDDVGVSAIAVTITNVDTKQTYPSDSVAINAKEKKWNVTINKYDETAGGWQLPDGKYEISVVARDSAGRTSGSTQRTFEIDNTPPLVILRSPATTDLKNPTAYGTTFKVTGTIADMHTIGKMALTIADEEGTICASTDSEPFTIEDVPTAGGTDVTVLQFGASDERGLRYKNIYGENKDGGTKKYRCAVTIADNAKRYQDPDENLADESLVAAKEGNGTSVVYLHDDVYEELMRENSGMKLGLSATELMQILNGTYTKLDDSIQDDVRAFLREKAIATTLAKNERNAETASADGGNEKSFLAFSLNPAVNPTYTVNGYNLSKTVSAPAKLPATIFVNKGLDENATLKPGTFKVYAKDFGTEKENVFTKYEEYEDGTVSVEYQDALKTFMYKGSVDEADSSITLLASNEDYASGSVDSYSWPITLPESVTPGHWYVIMVTGEDSDGNALYPNDVFGFLGSSTGFPPTVRVGEYKQAVCDSDAIKISGTATSNDYAIALLSYTVKVYDMDADAQKIQEFAKDVSVSAESENKTVPFTLDITEFAEYTKVDSGKNYKYDIVVSATDAEGNECLDPAEISVLVDTQPPVWKDEDDTAFVVGGRKYDATNWYNTDELTFVGYFFENEHGTGFDTATYRISSGNDTEKTDTLGLNKTTGTARFQAAISGIKHGSRITFTATDNAGNTSALKTITMQIDQNAPNIEEVTAGDFTTQRPASLTASADKVKVAFTVSDGADESGIDESSLVISVGTKEAQKNSDYTLAATSVSGDETKKQMTVTFEKSVLQNLDGTINVSATIKDKAGNATTRTIAILVIDSKPPEVKITGISPVTVSNSERLVNKIITVTGTASDSHEITRITLVATADGKTESVDCTNEDGIWTTTLDTQKLYRDTDQQELTLTVTARDSIGNETPADKPYTYPIKPKIDQNSDRPVIKVTNLQNGAQEGSYVLKYGDNAQLSGTITDDDASDSETVKAFYAASAPLGKNPAGWATNESGGVITATHATYGTTTLNLLSGEWTYTPAESDRKDGPKHLYFYIKDVAGTEFYSDAAATQLDRPYWQFKSDTKTKTEDNAKNGLAYTVDSESPVISSALVSAYANADRTAPYKDSFPVETSTVLGGTKARYAKFVITASDANGIDSLKVTVSGKEVVGSLKAMSGTDYEWTSNVTDLSGFKTGQVTLAVTATDKSGITGNGQFNFMVDFDAPKIESITPRNDVEQIGVVTISGFATDVGTADVERIQFAVPPVGTVDASKVSSYGGNLATGATTFAWSFICNDTANISFLTYVQDNKYEKKLISGDTTNKTDIWEVPVYFRVEDTLGNTGYHEHAIRYNPNADMPVTTITYPSANDYKQGMDYVILSGQIRVTGGVTIEDSNIKVAATYVQVGKVTDSGTIDWTQGKAWVAEKSLSDDGLTAYDGAGLALDKEALGLKGVPNNVPADWWGIKATNTTAWNVVLNKNDGLSPEKDAINAIAIRACAINENGKMGNWSEIIKINVDNAAPKLEYTLRQYDGDDPTTAPVIAEKPYVADMYLRNPDHNWWIVVDAYDESGINSDGVFCSGVSGNDFKSEKNKNRPEADNYLYYMRVSNQSSRSSYTITVPDNDDGGSHTTRMTFTLNVDNDAPKMGELLSDIKNSGSAVKNTKLRNNNYGVTVTATAEDSGSGFSRLAYFFKRSATNTIELPVPQASGSGWQSSAGGAVSMTISASPVDGANGGTVVGLSEKDDPSGLYGVWLKGGTRPDAQTFTNALVSYYAEKGLIRKGSLAKIGGTYMLVTEVSGSTVTFEDAVSADFKDAFFALAFIVDNTTAESGTWSSKTLTITNDDGDGMVESVKKSGATWTWETTFCSDMLQDGPLDIVCAAFDVAENVATQTTPVMIANNTPRLTKVFLATDLNGNGAYEQGEFVEGSVYLKDTTETDPTRKHNAYLSKLKSTASADDTAIVTVGAIGDWSNSADTLTYLTELFRVSDDSVITMEFVGNTADTTYEGYGSGNGDITAYLTASGAALNGPETNASRSINTLRAAGSLTNVAYSAAQANRGILLPKTLFSNSAHGTYAESTKDKDTEQYLTLTLWDSTLGTTPGVPDTKSGDTITKFGSQYTVLNIPVYYDFVDDRAPTVGLPEIAADKATGHVEQSDSLPVEHFGAKTNTAHNGTGDRDPKLSGTVTFTGTIAENKRIQTISVQMSDGGKSIGGKTTVATLAAGALKVTNPSDSTFVFAITKESFTQAGGHTVEYTLTVNTEKVPGYTANDIQFVLTANDEGGATGTNPELYFDVVPYITGITRSVSDRSVVGTTYRSTYGEYPVAVGDTLLVTGFNLGDNPTVKVGNAAVTAAQVSANSEFKVSGFTNSGELTFTVGGITNLNQHNNNSEPYNQEEADAGTERSSGVAGCILYDNRYLRVWDVNHPFEIDGGSQPTMATDNQGNIFSTWTLMGAGQVQMQRKLGSTSKPIYIGYDQPDKETALAIDQKSKSGSNVSVLFFPANVGSSGTPDSTGYADAQTMGGVWGVSLYNDFDNNSNYLLPGNTKHLLLKDNPYYQLDSKINSSGYQLASASMRREVSQFKQGRTVRYDDNMHFAYYDSYNKALRYTFQKAGKKISSTQPLTENGNYTYWADTSAYPVDRKDIVGWILIDGKSDEQDRIHRWTDNDLEYIWSDNGGNVSGLTSVDGRIGDDGYSISINGNWDKNAEAVAISYLDDSFIYRVFLQKVTKSVENNRTVYRWTGTQFPRGSEGFYTPTGLAVYRGDSNVVTKGDAKVNAAGSYSSIDVTTGGKPVIVYFDADNETLRIAYSSTATPDMYNGSNGRDTFTRQSLAGIVSGGTHVQCKIDGNNYLHIMYRDNSGKLCYLKSRNAPDGAAYTFEKADIMTIDTSGTYGTLSLIKDGSTYTPCVSWLNSEGTSNGVKYALLRDVDCGDAGKKELWDVQVVPAVKGNYVVGGETVYTEGRNGWTATEGGVSTGDCDAIIGYNTGRMDVLFLKSAK
ncbi:MAG: Ig-like domain repeat protein [Treponemataceae bacterium]|nr:Ig-like domain repeat protein [Treponemataceae bacterium]